MDAEAVEQPVRYEVRDRVGWITMSRARYANAQNSAMTYALDEAMYRASGDDDVAVVVLTGEGRHFSGGHDIGTPGRDAHVEYARRASMWWTHVGDEGASARMAREEEVYLGMCRRWREVPKPTIAAVHGACVAGGLMLAWSCDFIVAADDAYFQDPVLDMGIPGVEFFAHPWAMNPRAAKEFLFTGERLSAARALELGMVNRVVPRDRLAVVVQDIAHRIGRKPRLGLALAKKAINSAEDLMGLRSGMDLAFGLHHVAHAHNAEIAGDSLGGLDARRIKELNTKEDT